MMCALCAEFRGQGDPANESSKCAFCALCAPPVAKMFGSATNIGRGTIGARIMLAGGTGDYTLATWAHVATAIGTLLAVLVALYSDWFRAKLFPPVLSLKLVEPRKTRAAKAYVLIDPEKQQARETIGRWY